MAYAAVFTVQAVGPLPCVPLLRRIDVSTFAKDVAAASARRAAAALGWIAPRPDDVSGRPKAP